MPTLRSVRDVASCRGRSSGVPSFWDHSPNPFDYPHFAQPLREAMSLKPKEVERLLRTGREELDVRDYALILTAVRAGLREGELAGLRWGDIQFGESEKDADRYALVQRNYDRRRSRKMLTPKSK